MGRIIYNFTVGGALLGAIVSSVIYPRFSTWYNSPGLGKALCDCADITRKTADGMVSAQMAGVAIGAIVGVLLGALFGVWRRNKRKALESAATSTGTHR